MADIEARKLGEQTGLDTPVVLRRQYAPRAPPGDYGRKTKT